MILNHKILSITLALSLIAAPVLAQQAGSLSDMIEQREKKAQEKKKKKGGLFGKIAGVVTGIGAGAACGAFNKSNSNTRKNACLALGAVAGYGVIQLDKSIRKRLEEKDQEKLLNAAGDSLADGEPRSLAFPDSNASGSVTPTGMVFYENAKVAMFYDSISLQSRENVQVIAQPYLTTSRANLRGIPSKSGKRIKSLDARTPLHVVGQIPGKDWYMVSQKVSESDDEALMVVGYMSSGLLEPASDDYELPAVPAPNTVAEAEFDVDLKCNELTYQVRDSKGKLVSDTSKDCIGPEGQLISV